ncbi:PIG-L family deacetylase [Streptomyces sp. I05A-00742]|uniref:PIG-L family deacetylase n=1 Tax=Streptomyces sp. I05A-00742 TaxID=2732853 RepID=UPI001487CE60|nr:PIG-L family deacetylase [Streptomyces sp. I05A-00742]
MPGRISRLSRRRVLQVGGAGLVVGTGTVGAWQWLAPGSAQGSGHAGEFPVRPARAVTTESFVHIIAHPDDSLYFMNPELEQSIRSGAPTVTVCLTGGESDGRNALSQTPGYGRLPERRPEFVRARINGLREATAQMATGDWLSPWKVETTTLIPGFQVELQTLKAAPQVQLIFMELVEARFIRVPRKESLRGLWLGATPKLTTLVPADSPVKRTYLYERRHVIDSLVAVLDRYRPTVVRTLDPNPTHRAVQQQFPGVPHDLAGISHYDHQDHTTSAHFAQAALAEYWGRRHSRPTAVESFVGYEVSLLPSNLDAATTRHKVKILDTYGWADGKDCGDPSGCGDRKVGARSKDVRWSNNCRHRAPGTQRWVQPLPDGRLSAFALLDGTVHCWTETKAGTGVWSRPATVGGSMLEGQVEVLRHADGTLQLFGMRTELPGRGRAHRREIVTARQTGKVTGGGAPAFGGWESLGSPEADPARSMEVGYPVAVADKDGKVFVFARDWAGGVMFRTGEGGKDWTDWEHLAVDEGQPPVVLDGLDAALDDQGRVHVVAADSKTVYHWMSEGDGEPPQPTGPTRLPTASGPLSLAPLSGGGMRLVTRQPGTARVLVAERPGGGKWRMTSELPPIGGYGRVALAHDGRTVVLAARDDKGRVRLSKGSGRPGPWQGGGVPYRATPGIAKDARGRTTVVVLGTDGKLSSARTQSTGKYPFTAWAGQDGRTRSAAPSA